MMMLQLPMTENGKDLICSRKSRNYMSQKGPQDELPKKLLNRQHEINILAFSGV
ncbi:MAG: hypothetical protein K9K78_08545 [Spirochaetales bacterium]|nr:hypothetical protein [Spirochaetales bacterium]